MQPLQCQAWEQMGPRQLRRAEHSGQGSAGSPGQRWAPEESPPPTSILLCPWAPVVQGTGRPWPMARANVLMARNSKNPAAWFAC